MLGAGLGAAPPLKLKGRVAKFAAGRVGQAPIRSEAEREVGHRRVGWQRRTHTAAAPRRIERRLFKIVPGQSEKDEKESGVASRGTMRRVEEEEKEGGSRRKKRARMLSLASGLESCAGATHCFSTCSSRIAMSGTRATPIVWPLDDSRRAKLTLISSVLPICRSCCTLS